MRRTDTDWQEIGGEMGFSHPELQAPERSWDDRMHELYDFLTGWCLPEGVTVGRFRKLSRSQAMTIIWFLQEITEVLPDTFEQCASCKCLVNTYNEGWHDEKTERLYCDDCAYSRA